MEGIQIDKNKRDLKAMEAAIQWKHNSNILAKNEIIKKERKKKQNIYQLGKIHEKKVKQKLSAYI